MSVEQWQGPLWDAINRYVVACGGDPSKHVYGNTPRMTAVGEVNAVVRAAESRLQALIDRDRTGLAAAIARMVKEAGDRMWVTEGRGPYEWNDDRYKAEAGAALRAVIEVGKRALNDSGKLADEAFHPRPSVSPIRKETP